MATALTSVFGTEINVAASPRDSVRQYAGFAGGFGITCMHLGTRGYVITVTGTIRAATRALAETAMRAIEAYLWAAAADYTFYGVTYYGVTWDSVELLTDPNGKAFQLTAAGQVIGRFRARGRSLT